MKHYREKVKRELLLWEREMLQAPKLTNRLAKGFQNKMNSVIPDKAHQIITEAIKRMVKMVLYGSEYTTHKPLRGATLEYRDEKAHNKLDQYKTVAMASGWGTGAGGLLLGLADFPILLTIKMKFLFEIASIYGFDVRQYKERVFILYIFQLAFSSQQSRKKVYEIVSNWEAYAATLPETEDTFDWRAFQQEYRDYIDFAKMLQLMPGIGAFVGAYANIKLMKQLGNVAMQSYRLRILQELELK